MKYFFPKLIGILNVTPDSFSGDGVSADVLARAQQLIDDGADVVDVGAESTRPGATPLDAAEEWARLEPVIGDIIMMCRGGGCLVSLDTRHGETARRALQLGVDMINDVSGVADSAMIDALKDKDCKVVVMHSLSIPAEKSVVLADDIDVVASMREWCADTVMRLESQGISRNRLIVDPGIGFGKTARQSWQLLMTLSEWAPRDGEVLIGHSRKSFLSLVTDRPANERDDVTRAVSAMLLHQPLQYLRVHDVAGHRALLDTL